jgi:hypothetical protein
MTGDAQTYRRTLVFAEKQWKFIFVEKKFHDFFPPPETRFVLLEGTNKYSVEMDKRYRISKGIRPWFRNHPELSEGDVAVLTKHGEDYVISVEHGTGLAKVIETESTSLDYDHDDIANKLRDIGNWMGFEAKTKEQVAAGAFVDVVWKFKVGNLGEIKYAFEVQRKGSIDSAIRNLQRAQKSVETQKIVIVANSDIIEKVKAEVEGEDIAKILKYMDVASVEKAWQLMNDFRNVMDEVGLIKRI